MKCAALVTAQIIERGEPGMISVKPCSGGAVKGLTPPLATPSV
jgi:hypothetical protein